MCGLSGHIADGERMKLQCCIRPGQFCQTYGRSDLFGRIWELAHGINCDLEQHERVKNSLLGSHKIAPNASGSDIRENVQPESEELPNAAPQLRKTQARKPCGCKKKTTTQEQTRRESFE